MSDPVTNEALRSNLYKAEFAGRWVATISAIGGLATACNIGIMAAEFADTGSVGLDNVIGLAASGLGLTAGFTLAGIKSRSAETYRAALIARGEMA